VALAYAVVAVGFLAVEKFGASTETMSSEAISSEAMSSFSEIPVAAQPNKVRPPNKKQARPIGLRGAW
jgi:hypothetical protein